MDKTRFPSWHWINYTWDCRWNCLCKGAIFEASVVQNLSQIVTEIGGENGFVDLVTILIILAIFQRNK